MRIKDLLSEEFMTELSFMGSQCTKDCSGHRAGYKWSLDRGGVENPASYSQSFINGSNIGHRQATANKQQRTQGGGKIAGYQSQSAQAVAKRQARAQARVNQGVQGTPQNENADVDAKLDMQKLLQATRPYLTDRQWFALEAHYQGLSNAEIGQEMGIGAQGAYIHLVYALGKLKSVARTMGFGDQPASEYDQWRLRKRGPNGRNKPLPAGASLDSDRS